MTVHHPSFFRSPFTLRRLLAATVLSLAAGAAFAESFASSASSAASDSVGSLSNSISGSSNASSGDKKTAAGTYRIEQMAELAHKPGHVRLHLQALHTTGAAGALQLDLPRAAVQRQGVVAQGTIELRARPYGMEVAHAGLQAPAGTATAAPQHTAFFLLLDDAWLQDMHTRAVTL